jgi:hypothetical protein
MEEWKELVWILKQSNLSKDEALDFLNHAFLESQNNMAAIKIYRDKASKGDFRYATGFYGRLSETVMDENIQSRK